MPVIPLLSVLAAVGLGWLVSQLMVRLSEGVVAVSVLLVVAFVSMRPLPFYDQRADLQPPRSTTSTRSAGAGGDTDGAVASL